MSAMFSRVVPRRRFVAVFRAALAIDLFLLLVLSGSGAQAGEPWVIHDARTPIGYDYELEPHLVLGTNPPGPGVGSGVGIGVRGSVVVDPAGFIRDVNDSLAVGVGLDVGHYTGSWSIEGYRDQCLRFEPGPAGTSICTQVSSNGGTYNYVYVPVVMQWNFWLTQKWSAFSEPGVNLYYLGNHGLSLSPALCLGGRFRLTDRITLTARIGYPTVSFGVSFMM